MDSFHLRKNNPGLFFSAYMFFLWPKILCLRKKKNSMMNSLASSLKLLRPCPADRFFQLLGLTPAHTAGGRVVIYSV